MHLAPSHFLLCIHKKVIYAYQYLSNTETFFYRDVDKMVNISYNRKEWSKLSAIPFLCEK